MRPSDLEPILRVLVAAAEPVLITGKQGGGKSSLLDQVATFLGYEFMLMHPVTSDPTDVKGLPFAIERNGETVAEWLAYGDMRRLMNAKKPLVCAIDDLGHATQATQASFMQLLLARELNGKKISKHVRFVAASNRREDKAGVSGLISPLVDRFTAVFNLDPCTEDWVRWGLLNGMPPVLLAFNKLMPHYLEKYEASKEIKKVTSPRTMAAVGRMWNAGLQSLDAVAGIAGEGFATEFIAFAATFGDLPDRDEIILNPDSAPVPPESRPDVMLALMGSLAHAATVDNFDSIVRYLGRVPPEYAVCCVKNATARDRALVSTGGFVTFMTKNQKLMGLAA